MADTATELSAIGIRMRKKFLCDSEECQGEAAQWCKMCVAGLCSDCLLRHIEIYSDHAIEPLQHARPFCKEHGEAMHFYDVHNHKLVCWEEITEVSRSHVVDFQQGTEECRRHVEAEAELLKHRGEDNEARQHQNEDIRRTLEEETQRAHAEIDEERQLTSRIAELMCSDTTRVIANIENRKRKVMLQQREQIARNAMKLAQLKAKLSLMLLEPDVAFADPRRNLDKELDALLAEASALLASIPLDPTPHISADVSFEALPCVKQLTEDQVPVAIVHTS